MQVTNRSSGVILRLSDISNQFKGKLPLTKVLILIQKSDNEKITCIKIKQRLEKYILVTRKGSIFSTDS